MSPYHRTALSSKPTMGLQTTLGKLLAKVAGVEHTALPWTVSSIWETVFSWKRPPTWGKRKNNNYFKKKILMRRL